LASASAGVEHMDTRMRAGMGGLPPTLDTVTRTMVGAIFPLTDTRMLTPDTDRCRYLRVNWQYQEEA